MVETQEQNKNVISGEESPEETKELQTLKFPGSILSMVYGYLEHSEISKLSQSSLYYNLVTHSHYKARFQAEIGDN